MKKQLIVNADDYGHMEGVSRGIRDAHLHGIVTSTSTMMNRPFAVQALKLAMEETPKLGLGVHLCLTSGRPVLPVERVKSLVKADGLFCRPPEFRARLDQLDIDEVRAEWYAQVEQYVKTTGRKPDHLDSHHHSSYFTEALFEEMFELAAELRCPIRRPFGEGAGYLPGQLSAEHFQEMVANFADSPSAPQPLTTQGFYGTFYDEGATKANLLEILHKVIDHPTFTTFELMCHPAFVDDELMQTSSYNEQRERERQLLQDPNVLSLARNQLTLINFSQLNA